MNQISADVYQTVVTPAPPRTLLFQWARTDELKHQRHVAGIQLCASVFFFLPGGGKPTNPRVASPAPRRACVRACVRVRGQCRVQVCATGARMRTCVFRSVRRRSSSSEGPKRPHAPQCVDLLRLVCYNLSSLRAQQRTQSRWLSPRAPERDERKRKRTFPLREMNSSIYSCIWSV